MIKIIGEFRKKFNSVVYTDNVLSISFHVRKDQNIKKLNDLDLIEFEIFKGYAVNIRFIEHKRTIESDFDKLLKITDKIAKDLIKQSKSVSGIIESLEDYYNFKRGLKIK